MRIDGGEEQKHEVKAAEAYENVVLTGRSQQGISKTWARLSLINIFVGSDPSIE